MNTNVLKQHNILMRKTIGATGILKIVSNEDESSFLKKVTSFFIDKVSSLCDVFKSNENRLSSKYDTLKQRNVYTEELLKLRKDVIDITNTKDYFTIKHYNTPTVVGMRGNLLDILSVLEKGFELINKDLFENVEDLDVFLSTLISVEDTKYNSRNALPNDNVIKLNRQLDKILRDAIDPKKVIDVDKIENLIPNLSSLKSVYERTVNLESYTTSKAMLELQNSVSSITEKVNILISSLEDEEYEISKAMLKKVTTDMENTAQLVTNAASYLHLYNQLQFVVKNLILTIKDPSVSAESFSLNKKKQTVSNEGVIDFVKKLFSSKSEQVDTSNWDRYEVDFKTDYMKPDYDDELEDSNLLEVNDTMNLTGEDNREGMYAQMGFKLSYYSKDNSESSTEELIKRLDEEFKDTPGHLDNYKYFYNIRKKLNVKPYVITVNPKIGNIFNIPKDMIFPNNEGKKEMGVLDAIASGYFGNFDPKVVNKIKQLVELEWKKINDISKFVISKSKKLPKK